MLFQKDGEGRSLLFFSKLEAYVKYVPAVRTEEAKRNGKEQLVHSLQTSRCSPTIASGRHFSHGPTPQVVSSTLSVIQTHGSKFPPGARTCPRQQHLCSQPQHRDIFSCSIFTTGPGAEHYQVAYLISERMEVWQSSKDHPGNRSRAGEGCQVYKTLTLVLSSTTLPIMVD